MSYFESINPTTLETVCKRELDSDDIVAKKLQKANECYKNEWKKLSFKQRGDYLLRVAEVLRSDIDYYALPMTEEMGKPIKEARGEVEKAAWCAEHYAKSAEDYLAREYIDSDATKSFVQYLPLGVVFGILPWDAPFWLASRFFSPALMAGNTCIMKHDPHVPECSRVIAEAFKKAGFPGGAFQEVLVDPSGAERIIKDDIIKAVSFTGSDRAGAKVASLASSVIKPCVMELGGSDPSIILSDANLEEAADIVVLSRIINAGQSCIAAKRIIVEDGVYDEFVDMLKVRFEKLKMGDPKDESTDIGPIAREELREGLHRQVELSLKAGAKLLLGGEIPEQKGYFYPVTMLVDVKPDTVASCEETFGPIAVVMRAKDSEDALNIANNTPYGLGASVWTEVKRGEDMALSIESGQVSVNGIVKTDPRLPSGGVKRSGFGRELGEHGIKMFVNIQQVWIGPKKA
ncbi:MAG: NAD-dependent succinate-semialdehyde dehydrogenase [Campylobacterales bacterium]